MLPIKTNESLTCLQSLVKVRSKCDPNDTANFYLEDIEGVDFERLAESANVNSPSAKMFGEDLVNASAREMLSDIEFLIGSGYSLKPTFGELCSTCLYATPYVYRTNARVKVTNVVATKYSVLQIPSVQVLTDFTGTTILIVDDGTQTPYTIDLVAGQVLDVALNYSTQKKSATIYMQDSTIGLAKILCAAGGCGCSGVNQNNDAAKAINYSGLIGTTASAVQYGFLTCASVICSSDLMVCDLITQLPKIFGITLLYKVGAKYYSNARLSTRNNRTIGQDEEEKVDMQKYYADLYATRLQGSRTVKGIYGIVSAYLQQRSDKCVTCNANTKRAWATG